MKVDDFLEHGPKKVLIVNQQLLKIYKSNHTLSQDAITIRNILLDKYGRSTVDILTPLGRSKDVPEQYKTFSTFNLSDYDEVIVLCSGSSVFGGVYNKDCISFWKEMAKFKGNMYWYFNDVFYFPLDVTIDMRKRLKLPTGLRQANDLNKKVYVSDDELNNISNLCRNARILSSWSNYDIIEEKYKKRDSLVRTDWMFFDLNIDTDIKSMYAGINLDVVPLSDRKYDFLFYSTYKKFRSRFNTVANFTRDEDKKLLIGIKTLDDIPQIKNADISNVKNIHDIMNEDMTNTKFTLIFSDKECNNNICTWRVYECMYGNILAFIMDDYDAEHKYIKNEELKNYIYVKTPEEFFEKMEYCKQHEDFYQHLIELEREEML